MKNYNIKETAEKYLGQREIKGNQGFENKDFEKRMIAVGFRPSFAWCSLFSEFIWVEAFAGNSDFLKIIKSNFSASAVRTFKNFENKGMVSKKPVLGSVVIWQNFKKGVEQWTGHAGIVTEIHKDYFISIEGNTNDNGSREGYMVARKKRKYSTEVYNGLAVLGFINPPTEEAEKPFKNKKEGNSFRSWVHENHKNYAEEIGLDKTGSFTNSYILRAWSKYGMDYKK